MVHLSYRVEIPHAPPFPVDPSWLEHFRMDIRVATNAGNDMINLALLRSGKEEEWLIANEAWFASRSAKEHEEIKQIWSGGTPWHSAPSISLRGLRVKT